MFLRRHAERGVGSREERHARRGMPRPARGDGVVKSYAGMDEDAEDEPMEGSPMSPVTPAPPPAKRGRAGGSSRRGTSAVKTPGIPTATLAACTPGKTPLKSPATKTKAALTPNNDSRERLERRDSAAAEKLQRRRSNLVSAVDGNVSLDSSVPMLSGQQLADLYTNCIKLAQSNKISQKNAWTLDLINHLGITVKSLDEEAMEEEEGSFAKASLSLDAATKIYGYRVDSVHKDAFHVLGTVTTNTSAQDNAEEVSDREDEEVLEEGAEMSAEQVRKEREIERRLKAAKKKGNFIAKSVEEINLKTPFTRGMRNDPTFQMLTQWRAQSGMESLLCYNIIPNGGPRLSLDPNEVPTEKWHEDFIVDGKAPNECTMDPDLLQGIIDDLEKVVMDNEPSVPCMEELYRMAENLGVLPSIAEWEANVGHRMPMPDMHDTHSTIQSQSCGEVNGEEVTEEEDLGMDHGYSGGGDDVQLGALGDGPDDAFEDERNKVGKAAFSFGFTSEEDFICELPEAIARSWAGASHWRFKSKKSTLVGTGNLNNVEHNDTDVLVKNRAAGPRRGLSDTALEFDFLALPDVDWETALMGPKVSTETALKDSDSRTSAEPTLLPEDLRYEPRELLRLFLNPELSYSFGHQRGTRMSPRGVVDKIAYGDHADIGYGGGDDDGGFADFGEMDEKHAHSLLGASAPMLSGANGAGPFGLLQQLANAPRTMNGVKYARTAKSVDVLALKNALWTETRGALDAAVAEGRLNDGVSFRELVREAPLKHMAADFVEDVSVHMSFITMLHLANENGLRIEGCHAMDELVIFDK